MLDILPVENHIKQVRLNHMYKISKSSAPTYMVIMFQRKSQQYNARSSSLNYTLPSAKGPVGKGYHYNANQ